MTIAALIGIHNESGYGWLPHKTCTGPRVLTEPFRLLALTQCPSSVRGALGLLLNDSCTRPWCPIGLVTACDVALGDLSWRDEEGIEVACGDIGVT